MPQASQTAHKLTSDTALPYISNSSITSVNPQFITGSQNILTGLLEWAERRPGFSNSIASGFTNCVRNFPWRRWTGSTPNGGAFIRMFCDIDSGHAKVYKMIVGTDASPVLIWTSAAVEPFDFVVSNNTCYFGNGTDMKKFDSSTVTNWGIVGPTVTPTVTMLGSGSMAVYTSWVYCYTYFNSNTQHESSPSPLSLPVGPFTGDTPIVHVTASTDPQVTNIRIYRTPDGGAQDPTEMQEITGSPFANTTTTHNDTTPDTSLSIRVAPEFLLNDPPPAQKGFVAYAGRIWGFNTNTTFYSGFEEIANGVPEECWPSGLGGNFYPWDNEVNAHAPLIDGVAAYTAERIFKIEGDSLDTFRRYTLLERRGTRSRTSVASLGGSVAWLDTSNTVWISDIGEVGVPIRPDLQNINPLTAYMAIHISGIYHWLCLLDGSNGILYVYDLDRRQWQVPWTVGVGSGLYSAETNVGSVNLGFSRNGTKTLELVSGTYTDDASTYSAIIKTNMYRLTPDTNVAWKGVHAWSEIKTDRNVPAQVLQLTDDNPDTVGYSNITANGLASPDIKQGSALLTTRYPAYDQTAQFLSMKFVWPAANSNFHLYQMDEGFYGFGG